MKKKNVHAQRCITNQFPPSWTDSSCKHSFKMSCLVLWHPRRGRSYHKYCFYNFQFLNLGFSASLDPYTLQNIFLNSWFSSISGAISYDHINISFVSTILYHCLVF